MCPANSRIDRQDERSRVARWRSLFGVAELVQLDDLKQLSAEVPALAR
jgi:hypothetical protein